MAKEEKLEKSELRYYMVKRAIIYKDEVRYEGELLVDEENPNDSELMDLKGFASKDMFCKESHLLELEEAEVAKSKSIKKVVFAKGVGNVDRIRVNKLLGV